MKNALLAGDKEGINASISHFKPHGGHLDYGLILSIPSEERLSKMALKSHSEVLGLITVSLTLAFEGMNLSRPMSSKQIVDLASVILNSSNEDNISIEDVVLFLDGLSVGEYGPLYESMDIPKFMEKFEQYREKRHQAMVNIRYEQSVQHAPNYHDDRFSDMFKEEEKAKNIAAIMEYEKLKNKP